MFGGPPVNKDALSLSADHPRSSIHIYIYICLIRHTTV